MKRVFGLALATALFLVPAGSAWARGDGWQFLPFPPFDASCGTTTVHATAVVDKEYGRSTTLPDGTVVEQVTGALKINYATDAGASVSVNASGPGTLYSYPSGDVEIRAHGLNSYALTAEQAADLGVPQITVSAGPIDVTFHPDGSASGHLANIIQDVCAELGL